MVLSTCEARLVYHQTRNIHVKQTDIQWSIFGTLHTQPFEHTGGTVTKTVSLILQNHHLFHYHSSRGGGGSFFVQVIWCVSKHILEFVSLS